MNAPRGSVDGRDRLARILTRGIVGFTLAALVFRPSTSRGSIAEQRSRLPPPAHCEDPVEGEWKAHQYNDVWKNWVIFRLNIRRKPGSPSELVGSITNETWEGTKKDQEPGACGATVPFRIRVSMPDAFGTFTDGRVSFEARAWQFDELVCGTMPRGFGYRPDHFTGKVDEERQEFQSVNNDGGRAVNEPTLFRRIRCFDGPKRKEGVDVKPPPFVPPERSEGC
jgi:hypothetical protein